MSDVVDLLRSAAAEVHPQPHQETMRAAARIIEELRAREAELVAHLAHVTDVHHRTIAPSRLHDPEHIGWDECSGKTCKRTAELVGPRLKYGS